MTHSRLEVLIGKDPRIVDVKIKAKKLAKSSKQNLMTVQNNLARDLGYTDFFDFHNRIKKEYYEPDIEHKLLLEDIIKRMQEQLYNELNFYFKDTGLSIIASEMEFEELYFKNHSKQEKKDFFNYMKNLVTTEAVVFDRSENMFSKVVMIGKNKFNIILRLTVFVDKSRYFSFTIQPQEREKQLLSLSKLGFLPQQIELLTKYKEGLTLISGNSSSGFELVRDFISEINGLDNYQEINGRDKLKQFENNPYKGATATIHSTSPITSLLRMLDMSVPGETIAKKGALNIIVHQKRFPLLCTHCSILLKDKIKNKTASEQEIGYFQTLSSYAGCDKVRLKNPNGCKKCRKGISKFIFCAEVLEIDDNMRELIRKEDLEGLKESYQGLDKTNLFSDDLVGKTTSDIALRRVYEGLISPEDYERHDLTLKYAVSMLLSSKNVQANMKMEEPT